MNRLGENGCGEASLRVWEASGAQAPFTSSSFIIEIDRLERPAISGKALSPPFLGDFLL